MAGYPHTQPARRQVAVELGPISPKAPVSTEKSGRTAEYTLGTYPEGLCLSVHLHYRQRCYIQTDPSLPGSVQELEPFHTAVSCFPLQPVPIKNDSAVPIEWGTSLRWDRQQHQLYPQWSEQWRLPAQRTSERNGKS